MTTTLTRRRTFYVLPAELASFRRHVIRTGGRIVVSSPTRDGYAVTVAR